jgi:hypothetical protein
MKTTDKAVRIVEREGLCSVSSNSKWQRLIPVVVAFPCNKRIKYIDCQEPTRWQAGVWQPHPRYIEASGGPEELKFVEWIEIERCESRNQGLLVDARIQDLSTEIREALTSAGATFTETETSFLILGYSRPKNA